MNLISKCPWCGEQPNHLKSQLPGKSWVACDFEKCKVRPSTPYCNTWDEALKIWNTRKGQF